MYKRQDLSFSIKDIGAVKCDGHMNVPDGEVYSAPVKDSVNGRITYNTPSFNQGFKYENVSLLFKDGKIIEATSNDTKRINQIFDTDEGARYVGEFSLGVNPYINHSMGDILFDEKIAGSMPVSYTHLDVYKRQALYLRRFPIGQSRTPRPCGISSRFSL